MNYDKLLIDTCTIIGEPITNEYGDYISSGETTEKCRFRDIGLLRKGSHIESLDVDAELWLAYDSVAKEGSIVTVEDRTYQIDKINRARTLGRFRKPFNRCNLKLIHIS